ncbi:L-histidine N(alpha)-methyltransferase [uncultured Thiodictyon sp.]
MRLLHDRVSKAGAQGRLLIGIDTNKASAVLTRAYNDAAGGP